MGKEANKAQLLFLKAVKVHRRHKKEMNNYKEGENVILGGRLSTDEPIEEELPVMGMSSKVSQRKASLG